jgi:hypothetical protein
LVRQHENSLQAESSVAAIEELFKGRTESLQNQGIIFTFCAKPVKGRDARASRKVFVDMDFVLKLKVVCVERLELDGNLLLRHDVSSKIDDSYAHFKMVLISQEEHATYQMTRSLSAFLACTCHQP